MCVCVCVCVIGSLSPRASSLGWDPEQDSVTKLLEASSVVSGQDIDRSHANHPSRFVSASFLALFFLVWLCSLL